METETGLEAGTSGGFAEAEGWFFNRDLGVWGYAFGEGNARTDNRSCTDDGVAAEDGCIRVDHDAFFDRGMPFLGADQIAVFVLGKTECSQGDTLIDLDVGGDVGGFTDDDTGAVIDEEGVADPSTGVNIDPGSGVGPFGEHSGDVRDFEQIKLVGDTMGGDRFEPGVAEDDFIKVVRGGVAIVGGLNVERQELPDARQAIEELEGLGLAERFIVNLGTFSAFGLAALSLIVTERTSDLLSQLVVQAVDQVANVVEDVSEMEILATSIAGEDDFLEIAGDINDGIVAGKGAVSQVMNLSDLSECVDDALGQFPKFFLASKIGSHCEGLLPKYSGGGGQTLSESESESD